MDQCRGTLYAVGTRLQSTLRLDSCNSPLRSRYRPNESMHRNMTLELAASHAKARCDQRVWRSGSAHRRRHQVVGRPCPCPHRTHSSHCSCDECATEQLEARTRFCHHERVRRGGTCLARWYTCKHSTHSTHPSWSQPPVLTAGILRQVCTTVVCSMRW